MHGEIPFLKALGLDEAADERAVRRAYAQRLKRVDQAADPQGFQALRSDYENALRWVAWQARRRSEQQDLQQHGDRDEVREDVGPQPVVAAVPPLPTTSARNETVAGAATAPVPATPQRVADEVFEGFLRLARAGTGFGGEPVAQRALEVALNDDRLVNLEARTAFEWCVASLLMEGWRPGHEYLFGPACEVFHWEKERRHLALFGPLGAALDAAINEKLIFFRQPPGQFEVQRKLIRRLRDAQMPSARTLCDEMGLLQTLVQRYPHWLQIVTSRDNINQWRKAYEALPAQQRLALAPEPALAGPRPSYSFEARNKSKVPVWLIVMMVIGALGAIGRMSAPANDRNYGSPGGASWRANLPEGPPGPSVMPATIGERTRQVDLLKTRQREVDAEMKKVLDELRRPPQALVAGSTSPARRVQSARPQAPDAVKTAAPPTQWSQRSMYELIRNPDGSASAPRLGH